MTTTAAAAATGAASRALYRRCMKAVREMPLHEHRVTWHQYTRNKFYEGSMIDLRDSSRIKRAMDSGVEEVERMVRTRATTSHSYTSAF